LREVHSLLKRRLKKKREGCMEKVRVDRGKEKAKRP